MKKVSVLFVAHDNYHMTRLCLGNALENAGMEAELCYFDNGNLEPRMQQLPGEISNDFYMLFDKSIISQSKAINSLLRVCKGEYICIMPCPLFVGSGWLAELVDHAEHIRNTGIAAIHTHGDKGALTGLLMYDQDIKEVWKPQNNTIAGIMLFHRKFLSHVGGLDEGLFSGYEYYQYAYRVNAGGYDNYYINKYNAVVPAQISPHEYLFCSTQDDYIKNLSQMQERKDFTKELKKLSPNEQLAYDNLYWLQKQVHQNYSQPILMQTWERFGLMLDDIDSKRLYYVDQFCATYSLKYKILGSMPYNKDGVTILFESK